MELIITGDYSPTMRLQGYVAQSDYETMLGEVRPMFQAADYVIVNFESTVSTPSDIHRPINKKRTKSFYYQARS